MKRVMTFVLSVLFLLGSFTVTLADEAAGTTIDYSGVLEVSGVSQSLNSDSLMFAGPGMLDSYPTLGNVFKFRNDLRLIPNDQTTVRLRVSYIDDSIQNSANNQIFNLSRGFIDFTPNDRFSLRLGKQRLAWGAGYAWNPTDILDLPRNAFTDSDDPDGIMAYRGDLSLGPVTAQAVVTPGDSWEDSGRALRFKASPAGIDMTLGLAQKGTDSAATIADFAYSLAGVGIHGEALYRPEGNTIRTDKKDILNYLVGVDYNLPGGYYLALEYYHNDEAFENAKEFENYSVSKFTQALTEAGDDPVKKAAAFAELQTSMVNLANNGGITRDHFFIRAAKGFGDNINTELLLVVNPGDGSLVSQPLFEYTWKQNTKMFIKGMLASGGEDSEANLLPIQAQWNLGLKVSF